MPELPEVETVRRGLERLLVGAAITGVTCRRRDLRRPMPRNLGGVAIGPVLGIRRRAKYLLIDLPGGSLLSHLGMTGTWRHAAEFVPRAHDHVVCQLADGSHLVFNDPRRFGLLDWIPTGQTSDDLAQLGPEPLDGGFTGEVLRQALAGRKQAVKPMIMDQRVVVGVGNIYAQEALFRARIAPSKLAGRVSPERCDTLVTEIKAVLSEAIAAGGSTISDFRQAGGESGYFQTRFAVYDRAGQPCTICRAPLRHGQLGGRTTCWCPRCQRG